MSGMSNEIFEERPRLDELLDRASLQELLQSVFRLFGIPVRLFDTDGKLVASAGGEIPEPVCALVSSLPAGRIACEATVDSAYGTLPPPDEQVVHGCFTGAVYRIVGIAIEGSMAGRVVLGPYLPADVCEPPRSLLQVAPGMETHRARAALSRMPRLSARQATALGQHVRSTLEILLFAGQRALTTSRMHLAAMKEAHRELQQKNEELARHCERLLELDRLRFNFLATVSHELKTPLTSILGYAEMLSEGIGGSLTAEQQEFVRTIQERGEQLLGLITSLLDLAKLEQGSNVAMNYGPVSLPALATEVVVTFLPHARKRDIQIEVQSDPETPDARGDRDQLRRVLTNLLDNALKFSPNGSKVTVHIRPIPPLDATTRSTEEPGLSVLFPLQRDVEIRVHDTGVGIPPHEHDRVFDPFYQIDAGSTLRQGGAGLGLAIVKRIVDNHGGRITIESNSETTGTTFVVQLPAMRD